MSVTVESPHPIFSSSVALTLRWLHGEKVSGFEHDDVLVTADFIELHDQLFDILNCRTPNAPGFKASITVENFDSRKQVFGKIRQLYAILEHDFKEKSGKIKREKMIHR